MNAYSQDFVDAAKCKEIASTRSPRAPTSSSRWPGSAASAPSTPPAEGVFAIGVDADQSFAGDCVITSALKPLELAVFETICKSAQDGTFEGGTNRFFGIEEFPDAQLLAPLQPRRPGGRPDGGG